MRSRNITISTTEKERELVLIAMETLIPSISKAIKDSECDEIFVKFADELRVLEMFPADEQEIETGTATISALCALFLGIVGISHSMPPIVKEEYQPRCIALLDKFRQILEKEDPEAIPIIDEFDPDQFLGDF